MLKHNLKQFANTLKYLKVIVLLCGITARTLAQDSAKARLNQIFSTVNGFYAIKAVEKLYLHTDKASYSIGDTLRFKAYLLQASSLSASTQSGVLYIEIANDSNRVMKRTMLPLYGGLGYGQITLDDREMPQGEYMIRAYTNWQRNFGEDYIFKKHFFIGQPGNKDWLVNYNARTLPGADKNQVQLNLRINQFNLTPVMLRKLQLSINDGRRTWLKNDAETDLSGQLAINFDLPEKAESKHLSLLIQDLRKGETDRKILMPLILNRPDHIDLQFMPEGGYLVAGLPARIALKAINEDGYGVNLLGEIQDSKQKQVAVFSTTHKGIGAFYLVPQAGEVYTARVQLPDGLYKNYPLPVVKPSGITLRINNRFKSDSLDVFITATPDVSALGKTIYLIGHARGTICYGASLRISGGWGRIIISKKDFPSGVAHFTLTDQDKNAISERIVFIDHNDNLNVRMSTHKADYKQRDSVALNIQVTDAGGAPVQGSFSLAVTDNVQTKADSLTNNSIVTQMLLTADLKGTVEDPGYYYHCASDSTKWQNLDNLLLAQGWVGYNWNDAFNAPKPLAYPAEPEFVITGRVTNAFNKPVANSGVTLFSKKPVMFADTVTNARGVFTFKGIMPTDTAIYFLQARNKKGKSFNVGIEIDEFKPPVFTMPAQRLVPWYVNIDTPSLLALKKQVILQDKYEKLTGANLLKDVVIRSKRIVKGSKNLNGAGQADLIIDEAELEKAGRTTLGDLLRKRAKGFGFKANKDGEFYYHIFGQLLHLVIDGVNTDFFMPEGASRYEFLNEYFEYYDAEEIKGIEVMSNPSYASRYAIAFLDPRESPFAHSFIEVTTRSGHGPFVKKAVGAYMFRPMPSILAKQFYAPKYKPGSIPNMTDIRSTIHWEPNIVTDKDGIATISFYTADNPGTYTLILEGADMAGNVGAARGTLTVKALTAR
jgi:hypothetical protein